MPTDRNSPSVDQRTRGARSPYQALVASGVAFVSLQYIACFNRQTYGRLEIQARIRPLGSGASSVGCRVRGTTGPAITDPAQAQADQLAEAPRIMPATMTNGDLYTSR